MGVVFSFLVVAAGYAAIMYGLRWLGTRARSRGVGGAAMAVIDEIYHPSAHQAHAVIQAQAERGVATPSPGDPPTDAAGKLTSSG